VLAFSTDILLLSFCCLFGVETHESWLYLVFSTGATVENVGCAVAGLGVLTAQSVKKTLVVRCFHTLKSFLLQTIECES